MTTIRDAQARLDRALIEGAPIAAIRAELAQLEQDARLAAERDAASAAAEAGRHRAKITARGANLAGETANRINSMMTALSPAPFSSSLSTGVAS